MSFDPITAALEIGGKIIDKVWPDPTQAAAAKLSLFQLQQTGELAQLTAGTEIAKAQLAVNAAEAVNPSMFVSGWRPFIGWVCGAAFAYHFVVQPFAAFILVATGHAIPLPAFDMSTLLTVLAGMLGLGSLRTFEKFTGTA